MPHEPAPLVSIGVPVYNGGEYLAAALRAIELQEFTDFEVIISDNASTDDTADICRDFAERDSRVRYVRQERNLGGSPNFNFVAHEARGKYFKWATHDDLIPPDHLRACVDALEHAPERVILVYPRTVLIDAEGREVTEYDDGLDLREPTPSARLRHLLERYELSNALHGLHRREALLETSMIAPYHSSDVVLLAEIALAGEIWELEESVFYRRYHDGMARLANMSDTEFNAWFDTSKAVTHPMPRTRLFIEDAKAIAKAEIPVGERARSMWALGSVWGPRYWRVVGGEFKREIYGALRVPASQEQN